MVDEQGERFEFGETALTWVGEMPVPTSNVVIHFESYVLEQWLRRVALAALMARAGAKWLEAIPPEIANDAKRAVKMLRRRTYLDPENSDNVLWALTLEQLRQILVAEDLAPFVFDLMGISRRTLSTELEKFREIRNIVAHHRATNEVALENFRLVSRRLQRGIAQFKRRMVYTEGTTVIGVFDEPLLDAHPIAVSFADSGLAQNRWYLLTERGQFYDFGIVYGDPVASTGFVDVGNLLDLFHEVRHLVLCVTLAGQPSEGYGGELQVVWPKDIPHADLLRVRDACLRIRGDSTVPYEEQDPKHVCDPLIWFEHGRTGAAEAGLRREPASGADTPPRDQDDSDDVPF